MALSNMNDIVFQKNHIKCKRIKNVSCDVHSKLQSSVGFAALGQRCIVLLQEIAAVAQNDVSSSENNIKGEIASIIEIFRIFYPQVAAKLSGVVVFKGPIVCNKVSQSFIGFVHFPLKPHEPAN